MDPCLFVKRIGTRVTYISLYVDDMIITGTDENDTLKVKDAEQKIQHERFGINQTMSWNGNHIRSRN